MTALIWRETACGLGQNRDSFESGMALTAAKVEVVIVFEERLAQLRPIGVRIVEVFASKPADKYIG